MAKMTSGVFSCRSLSLLELPVFPSLLVGSGLLGRESRGRSCRASSHHRVSALVAVTVRRDHGGGAGGTPTTNRRGQDSLSPPWQSPSESAGGARGADAGPRRWHPTPALSVVLRQLPRAAF